VFGSRLTEYEKAEVNMIKEGTRDEMWELRRNFVWNSSLGKHYHKQGKSVAQVILMMVGMASMADGTNEVCPYVGEVEPEQEHPRIYILLFALLFCYLVGLLSGGLCMRLWSRQQQAAVGQQDTSSATSIGSATSSGCSATEMHRRATQTEATESEPTVVVRTEYMMLDWPEEVYVTEFGQCFHMRPNCYGLSR